MLRNTKKSNFNIVFRGFTLIELLVAVAVIGIISIISVQGLYDIVSYRAKQQTIEDSSDTFRVVSSLISKSVIEAENVNIPDTKDAILLKNEQSCKTIKYDSISGSVRYKVIYVSDINPLCSPPQPDTLTDSDSITNKDFMITSFSVSPSGINTKTMLLEMEGNYKNSIGDHPLKYSTTITRRI